MERTYKTHCNKNIKPGEHCCNNPCCYACPYPVEGMELFEAGTEACDATTRFFDKGALDKAIRRWDINMACRTYPPQQTVEEAKEALRKYNERLKQARFAKITMADVEEHLSQ